MKQTIIPAWITRFDDPAINVFDDCTGTIFIHGVMHKFICEDYAMNLHYWQQAPYTCVLVRLAEKTPFHFSHINATVLE